MLDWQCDIAVQRQQEMLKSAQQYRLVVEARACMDRRPGWASCLLCWLGASLVSVGRWLQIKSGVAPAPTAGLVFLAGRDTTAHGQNGIEVLRKVA